MPTPALTFYFAPGSSSMAAHIALHEVHADFEPKAVALRTETRSEAFLKLNPQGTVPLLVIDGRPLTEVAAILYYLARRFPEARLLPAGDPEAEAHVVSWMSFVAAALHPTLSAYNGAIDDTGRRAAQPRARRIFELADQRLGGGPWAAGDYSIADIHLFRLYFRYRHTFDTAPGELPNLAAHYDRMLRRTAVLRTCEIEAAIGYALRNFTPPVLPRQP